MTGIAGPEPNAGSKGQVGTANPAVTAGSWGVMFYIFAYYSRVLDLGLAQLHLPAIAFGFAAIMAVVSFRIVDVLQTGIGRLMVALTAIFVCSVPVSYWRGGSFGVLTQSWIPAMVLFLVSGSLITTIALCRRSLYVLGAAAATAAALLMIRGQVDRGRLLLDNSMYRNSNTIAIMLLLGMPMVWAIGADPKAGAARKFMMSGTLALMAAMVLRSGSREGLLGLAILGLIAFVRSSARGKVAIVAGAMLFSIAAIGFLPRGLKARFGTIFGDSGAELWESQTEEEYLLLSAAAGSAETRWDLLVTSLQVTVRHPLLGVGPGNFAPYTAEQAKANGRNGYWVGTHNTYTQISSEAGIPALCVYLAILGGSIAALRRIRRRAMGIPGDEARSIANMALALQTSFIAFAILCPFNHMAYEPTMPLLAALAVAVSGAAPVELSRLEDAGTSAEAGSNSAIPPLMSANPAGKDPRRVRAAAAGC